MIKTYIKSRIRVRADLSTVVDKFKSTYHAKKEYPACKDPNKLLIARNMINLGATRKDVAENLKISFPTLKKLLDWGNIEYPDGIPLSVINNPNTDYKSPIGC